MEKPYWAGKNYWVEAGMTYCLAHTGWGSYRPLVFIPDSECAGCRGAVIENERNGFMKQPKTEKTFGEVLEEACQNSQKSTKYSFVGRPDFNRIIQENEGAEVIIVSREDGLVTFLFRLGNWTSSPFDPNIFRRAEKDLGVGPFELGGETVHNGPEPLPREWAAHYTADPGNIKDLRRIARYIVRARTGKHTVEVLP